MIVFRCPGCRAALQVPDNKAGKRGHCPRCRGPIVVPLEPPPIDDAFAPTAPPRAAERPAKRPPREAPPPRPPEQPAKRQIRTEAPPPAGTPARQWSAKFGSRALPTRPAGPAAEDEPIDATAFVGGTSRRTWVLIGVAATFLIVILMVMAMWFLFPPSG